MVQTFSRYALVGVDWQSTRWHEVPLAPPLGELLSEREAEGVWFVNTELVPIRSCPVGADSIRPPANGAERLDE